MSDDFVAFQKIPRLSRECVITEKIDGTNALVAIGEDGSFRVGSKSRWITPSDDNYGFAAWAYEHRDELMRLGPGRHFGEWWGRGIQRNYAQPIKRFSLFNVSRWADGSETPRPACCDVVPTLYAGPIEEYGVLKGVKAAMTKLLNDGSQAAPGFMQPEGIVVYHVAGGLYFKKTFEKDAEWKGKAGGNSQRAA